MRKAKTLIVVFLMGIASMSQAALTINWGASVGVIFGSDTVTLLHGIFGDATASPFAQLIFAGEDGIVGTLDYTQSDGIAVADDDEVLALSYMGEGALADFPLFTDGLFADTTTPLDPTTGPFEVADLLYMRIFDMPADNWATAAIPTSGNYVEYSPYSVTQGDLNASGTTYGITETISTTTQVVPEPGTMFLFLIGALTAVGARRKRRS